MEVEEVHDRRGVRPPQHPVDHERLGVAVRVEALPEDDTEETVASRETAKTAKPRARKAAAKGEDKAEGEA